jgi:hypothetical protein
MIGAFADFSDWSGVPEQDIIDADGRDRYRELSDALRANEVVDRDDADRIAVFAPARNIETWLAYLAGQEVNEIDRYPRLPRERDCQQHVDTLVHMCDTGQLREPSPSSLVTGQPSAMRDRAGVR